MILVLYHRYKYLCYIIGTGNSTILSVYVIYKLIVPGIMISPGELFKKGIMVRYGTMS